MEKLVRLTAPTVVVLKVLAASDRPMWGLAISKNSGLPTGTVYPILARLESLGWVNSYWEEDSDRSGPRRKFYTLTAEAALETKSLVAKLKPTIKNLNIGVQNYA